MIEIPLQGEKGRGKKAKIDDADLPLVKGKRWMFNQGYAVTYKTPSGIIGMHRVIMQCTDPAKVVDHINGDRLDNRRIENLRIVSRFDNWKHKTQSLTATQHEGIFYNQYTEKFHVRLYESIDTLYGKRREAGAYKTIEEALKVRNAEVKHGGFLTKLGPRSWDKLKTPEDAPPPTE
jgi:hypothetical protein